MTVRHSRGIDAGLFVVRLAVGAVFIAHGWQKLFVMGYPAVTGFVGSLGIPFPAVGAALLIGAELGGGILLVLGALTRFAGLMLLVDMIVAAATVHFSHGFFLPAGFEYTFVLGLISLALMLSGAGVFSVDALFGRPRVVEDREYRMAA